MSKKINYGHSSREEAVRALQDIACIVGSTLGPSGRPVLITKRNTADQLSASHTKDGFNVLQSLNYADPVYDAVHKLCLQAAANSVIASGDGTTSSIVMAAEFAGQMLFNSNNNPQAAIRSFRNEVSAAIEAIGAEARFGKECEERVALTSSNGDVELTKFVLEAISEGSAYGSILVEKAPNSREAYKIDKEIGYQAGQGYSWFAPLAMSINDKIANNAEFFMKDIFVLPFNGDLVKWAQLSPAIEALVKHKGPAFKLLVVCYESSEDLGYSLVEINRKNPDIKIFLTKTTRSAEINGAFQQLNDIAAFSGAQVIDAASLPSIRFEDLGNVQSARIGTSKTFLQGRGAQQWIAERALQNEEAARVAPSQMDREIINSRNASLTGGLVKLVIGGGLFGDLPERADRAEDAIKAAQACMRSGALPGCGASYIRAGLLASVSAPVQKALSSIHDNIMENCGDARFLAFGPGQSCYIGEHSSTLIEDFLSQGVADSYETVKAVIKNSFELAAIIANLGGYSLEADHEQIQNARLIKDVLGGP